MAYLPLGIHVEIEYLRLDFHVLPVWMIDVEAPRNRVFETRFLIGLFQIFRLYSLTLTHTHTLSLSHKPKHSHFLSLTYIFPPTFLVLTQSELLTKLSHFLSISHTASHIHTRAHTHTQPRRRRRAEPNPAQRRRRRRTAQPSPARQRRRRR